LDFGANEANLKKGLHVRNSKKELLILTKVKREASLQKLPTRPVLFIFKKIISPCEQAQYRARKREG
jgi:chorismate mutase